jgi:hypothetical protein
MFNVPEMFIVLPAPQIRRKTQMYRYMCHVPEDSCYLQPLKRDAKHNNIFIFAMFRKYSWYLQRLKDDAKRKKYRYVCNVPEVFMVPPAPQRRCKTQQYRYVCNVPEVFMAPPAPQIRWETQTNTLMSSNMMTNTIISLSLQCSGGIHRISSASNTMTKH